MGISLPVSVTSLQYLTEQTDHSRAKINIIRGVVSFMFCTKMIKKRDVGTCMYACRLFTIEQQVHFFVVNFYIASYIVAFIILLYF